MTDSNTLGSFNTDLKAWNERNTLAPNVVRRIIIVIIILSFLYFYTLCYN